MGSERRGGAWAVVLAGGQGMRLRRLTHHLYGDDRPKQFAVIAGGRSLLQQTLQRVGLRVPRERTLVVVLREHAGYLASEFAGAPAPRLLVQPSDRGTAAAILLAVNVGLTEPAAKSVSAHYPQIQAAPWTLEKVELNPQNSSRLRSLQSSIDLSWPETV